MTAEGTFPKSDGDVLYGSEVNAFNKDIYAVYSGTGFDTSNSVGSYTFGHIPAGSLTGKRYIKTSIGGLSYVDSESTGGYSATVSLGIEVAPSGAAYVAVRSGIQSYMYVGDGQMSNGANYEGIYGLSAVDLVSGCSLQVLSTSAIGGAGANASFTNEQTVVEVLS